MGAWFGDCFWDWFGDGFGDFFGDSFDSFVEKFFIQFIKIFSSSRVLKIGFNCARGGPGELYHVSLFSATLGGGGGWGGGRRWVVKCGKFFVREKFLPANFFVGGQVRRKKGL
jgi:hypothetical protein